MGLQRMYTITDRRAVVGKIQRLQHELEGWKQNLESRRNGRECTNASTARDRTVLKGLIAPQLASRGTSEFLNGQL